MAQAIPDPSLQPDLDRLQTLVADLWYPSETDAPVTVVVWPSPPSDGPPEGQAADPARTVPQELAAAGTPITQHPAERFFQPILGQPFWHSPQGEHLAQRYQPLQDFLQATLSNLHTYRIGQVEITLYLVGRHPSGHYLGVTTNTVET